MAVSIGTRLALAPLSLARSPRLQLVNRAPVTTSSARKYCRSSTCHAASSASNSEARSSSATPRNAVSRAAGSCTRTVPQRPFGSAGRGRSSGICCSSGASARRLCQRATAASYVAPFARGPCGQHSLLLTTLPSLPAWGRCAVGPQKGQPREDPARKLTQYAAHAFCLPQHRRSKTIVLTCLAAGHQCQLRIAKPAPVMFAASLLRAVGAAALRRRTMLQCHLS